MGGTARRRRAGRRDADRRLAPFVGENLDALLAELTEEGAATAASVDAACHALVSAFHGRQQVESRLTALCALVRTPRVGDVGRTRAEQVVREAGKLLEAGGEMPPALRADPRQPRYAETLVEADERDPVPAA